jgi:hypothetical protein|tara:strand:+ start:827 stop:1723 length:897 start_codon:yes stop_codon:yes gene_type:complete
MKNIRFNLGMLIAISVLIFSCQNEGDDYEFGDIITPSNIQTTFEIIGADTLNPYGDGSGVVNFTSSADNAVSYKYVFNGNETVALDGKLSISFSDLGINTYTVVVVASGTAGVSSSIPVQVEVISTYSPPADLLEKLHGSSSKEWRVKAESSGHFGLGPVGGTTPVEWYGAGPNEKDGLGMYDDRFVFDIDGTFTHTTNGTIFGRDPHAPNDLGPITTGNVNGADIENYVYNDYTESWLITAPGGVETISLTGFGFIGYYTGGNHKYEIFNRDNANELVLKTTDAASDFDWWFIITSN